MKEKNINSRREIIKINIEDEIDFDKVFENLKANPIIIGDDNWNSSRKIQDFFEDLVEKFVEFCPDEKDIPYVEYYSEIFDFYYDMQDYLTAKVYLLANLFTIDYENEEYFNNTFPLDMPTLSKILEMPATNINESIEKLVDAGYIRCLFSDNIYLIRVLEYYDTTLLSNYLIHKEWLALKNKGETNLSFLNWRKKYNK